MTHVSIRVDAAIRMLIVKPNGSKSFTPMPCHATSGEGALAPKSSALSLVSPCVAKACPNGWAFGEASARWHRPRRSVLPVRGVIYLWSITSCWV